MKAQLAGEVKQRTEPEGDRDAFKTQLGEATARTATMVAAADHEALKRKLADAEAPSKKSAGGDIERIEGIGPVYGQKLRAAGIAWVRELLARGTDAEGRKQIAAQTGLKEELVLKWVNAAGNDATVRAIRVHRADWRLFSRPGNAETARGSPR